MMGKLELRRERGILHHYLDGKLVEVGARLEVLLRGGTWIAGIYDWNGTESRWAGMRFELGGDWEADPRSIARPPSAVMALHPDALLRWPAQAPRSVEPDNAGTTLSLRRSAITRSSG